MTGPASLLRTLFAYFTGSAIPKTNTTFAKKKPMNYGHSIPRWLRTDALPISAEGDAVTVRAPWTCGSDVCYLCRVIFCATSAS